MAGEQVCAYCGAGGELSRDHVVPRSRGGPDNATNIVMACRPCNSSKGGMLASEWLGERCPAAVLLIEARVNAKLKAIYRPRDRRGGPAERLYAFSVEGGRVQYIGEVVEKTDAAVCILTANVFTLWCGFWELTGELREVPRDCVRLFNDREAMLDAVDRQGSRS